MHKWILAATLLALAAPLRADPTPELIGYLKASVVKVHAANENNHLGVGTGVVVSPNHVATNCHVLANANGITVRKFGQGFSPVAILADWKHDLCILRVHELGLEPVQLGDSASLEYEQPIFSIGFPLNTPKPQVLYGKIKALYPHDGSRIIRTSASFRMGASGSPLLDEQGRLIGISTFKSPGRNSYYYNLPVDWVKKLLATEGSLSTKQLERPFWDSPEAEQPYFMRVVLPYMGARWSELSEVAQQWMQAEPDNAEAWYYRAYAEERLGNMAMAVTYYEKALALRPEHTGALFELGLHASRQGNRVEFERISMLLSRLDESIAEELNMAAAGQ